MTFAQLEVGTLFELRNDNPGYTFTKIKPIGPLATNAKTWDDEGRQSWWFIEEDEEVILA